MAACEDMFARCISASARPYSIFPNKKANSLVCQAWWHRPTPSLCRRLLPRMPLTSSDKLPGGLNSPSNNSWGIYCVAGLVRPTSQKRPRRQKLRVIISLLSGIMIGCSAVQDSDNQHNIVDKAACSSNCEGVRRLRGASVRLICLVTKRSN